MLVFGHFRYKILVTSSSQFELGPVSNPLKNYIKTSTIILQILSESTVSTLFLCLLDLVEYSQKKRNAVRGIQERVETRAKILKAKLKFEKKEAKELKKAEKKREKERKKEMNAEKKKQPPTTDGVSDVQHQNQSTTDAREVLRVQMGQMGHKRRYQSHIELL
ncbi:uncharacterized protein H6S33_004821 [Morchella sextelata]|uniref:uncharacterized protein n=1 Tax=Morchella sextelata TaxID=1174677 RepID=UPI001D04397F|nr:uncharacterized protein H6S33_004821 [Morchella sextelata]KAH0605599.1 hypothetical protein H6S33_004821 [Morchella sextelata]